MKLHSLPFRRTAFVDYDSEEESLSVPELHSICRVIGFMPLVVCYCKSRRGIHLAMVFAENMTDIELIALQCILKDDRMRAANNFKRYWTAKGKKQDAYWMQRSNILYIRKV